MDLTTVSAFFDQSVPLGVVFIVVYLIRMGRDLKHINEKLDNHITDTNKKIDDLRQDVKENFKETQTLKQGQIELKSDMKEIKVLLNKQSGTNQAKD